MDSIVTHKTNISKHEPITGRSYIKLPKKIDNSKKRLFKSLLVENTLNGVWSDIYIL